MSFGWSVTGRYMRLFFTAACFCVDVMHASSFTGQCLLAVAAVLPIALLAWMWLIGVSNSIVMLFDRCFGRTLFGVSSDGFIIIVGEK